MNCWFWNIDSKNREYFSEELEQGRLRQGWGYQESLDLKRLQAKIEEGKELSRREQRAWDRCKEMLNRIQEGDLVVVKTVPRKKYFTVVKVVGGYCFQLDDIGDYGHVLPVEKVAEYHKLSKPVPSPFKAALDRARHPIRVTYKHKDTVLDLAKSVAEALTPHEFKERLDGTRDVMDEKLRDALKSKFDPKMIELLVEKLLLYEGLDVADTSGRCESGADRLGQLATDYGFDVTVAVQVKAHWGVDNGVEGVAQLEKALEKYDVQAGLLVTMADQLGDDLETTLEESQRKYNISVLYGPDLYRRLNAMLMDPEFQGQVEGEI